MLNGLSLFHAQTVHDGGYSLRAEYPEEIILKGKIEARGSGISLAARSTPELVVDTTAFMPFRSEDVEAIQIHDTFAQHNICSSARHIGGDGHGLCLACLRNDFRFLLVMLGIQYRMGDACPFQHLTQHLRFFDGDGTHENRLSLFIKLRDLFRNRFELLPFSLIDRIRVICANHFFVGGYDRNIQFICTIKFSGLRVSGTCHSGEFFIHPEIVLKGDGGQGLVLFCHTHAFLCLHRLMQTVAPAATRHHASRELIHNDHLSIFDDIMDILLE